MSTLQIPINGNVYFTDNNGPIANVQIEIAIDSWEAYGFLGYAITDAQGLFTIYATDFSTPDILLNGNYDYLRVAAYVNGHNMFIDLEVKYNGYPISIGISRSDYEGAMSEPGTDAHYGLKGHIQTETSGVPLSNILVNVTDSAGTYGQIAKGSTNANGDFGFLVFDSIDTSLIVDGTIAPLYNIVVNGETIYSSTISGGIIYVPDADYEEGLAHVPVQRQINARVLIAETNMPVVGVRLDGLYSDYEYGVIGTGLTDTTGTFIMQVINDPTLDLSSANLFFQLWINGFAFFAAGGIEDVTTPFIIYIGQAVYDDFFAAHPTPATSNPLVITGKVAYMQTGLPLPGVEVDMVDSSGNYGKIGSANTDTGGNFSISITNTSVAIQVAAQLIIPTYKVLQNCTFILSQTTAYTTSPVLININQSTYDAAIPCSQNPTIQIAGNVTAGGIVVQGTTVNIYESGFRTKVLLTSTTTDINGRYNATISTRNLNNIAVVASTSIRVEAVDSTNTVIASSGDVFSIQDGMQVNLVANSSVAPASEFSNLLQAVQAIVGPADIGSLTIDPDTSTDELSYVNNALGRTGASIDDIVKAHKYATETSLSPEYLYALVKATDGNRNPLLNLTASQITGALSDAAANNVITAATGDIDTFVTAARAYQVTATQALPVAGETYTANDVLRSFFESDTDVSNFLAKYNETEYATTADFWTAYTTAYGAPMAQKAQSGLQVAAVTGFQPQIMSSLMGTIGTGNVSQLAAWTTDTWLSTINTVCAATDTLCVPSAIRGTSTDPNDMVVKTKYAQLLSGTVKNMYPLTSISVDLQGSDGHLIINDPTTRSQTVTLIGNNPSFDLRQNSIHEIFSGSSTVDLTGITDPASVQAAMAPIQRILRITGGTPDAVSQIISSGFGSAWEISQMGQDAFVSSFTDVLGGDDVAAAAYAKAVYVNQYASHTLVDAVQASNNIVNVLPGMSLSSSSSSSRSDSSTIEPDLTTFFGSLDYCSCDQCLSMYSPAAYLADTLNFLKINAPAAYAELLNRREDIIYIDLSCKNTNTSIPYIDLVNELLELLVLKSMGTSSLPLSFQTNGTQAELAAYPEHTIKNSSGDYVDFGNYSNVYNIVSGKTNLANSVYPSNLPFSLALEETRSYMQYLGNTRYQMMELFTPFLVSPITATNEITGYSTFSEWLGIPQASADIITKSVVSATPWIYYGFSSAMVTNLQDPEDPSRILTGEWDALLCGRIDVLLKQTNITYTELLQILGTTFINPNGYITISANSTATNPETCALNELQLVFIEPATIDSFLDKLYRFVRLYRSGKLTIAQWDILLRSFGILQLDSSAYQMDVQWPLHSSTTDTSTNTNALITASNIVIGSMISGGAYNQNGYNCQIASGNWPQVSTDGYNIDFPIAPVTNGTLTLNEIDFTVKYSGNTATQLNYISFAYSINGGAFTPCGSTTTVLNPESWNNFYSYTQTGLNIQCASGSTLTIRMYLFTDTGVTHSRHIYISAVALTGTVSTVTNGYISGTKNGDNLTEFEVLGKGIRLADTLKIAPELLASWWSDLDTHNYLDYNTDNLSPLPSLYQGVFSNRAVVNDPNNISSTIFADPTHLSSYSYINDTLPSSAPIVFDSTANIASFCRVGQSDVVALLELLIGSSWNNMMTPISLTILSRIYVMGQLSKVSGYSVSDLLTVVQLLGININPAYPSPGTNTVTYSDFLDNLQSLSDTITALKISPFTVTEYDYLINNIDDLGTLDPTPLTIQLFYEALRTDLYKCPAYVAGDADILGQLTNVVYQHFSGQFSISSQWVQDILDPDPTASPTFTVRLVTSVYMTHVPPLDVLPGTDFDWLYAIYRQMYKTVFIASRLKFSTSDFEFFYQNSAITGFPFDLMQVTGGTIVLPHGSTTVQTMFQGLLCMSRWTQVRDTLFLPDTGLSTLLSNFVITTLHPAPLKSDWLTFFETNTNWSSAALTALVGTNVEVTPLAGAPDNLLRTTFPDNFTPGVYDNVNMIFTINNIVNFGNRTGLSSLSMQNVLRATLTLDDSHKILLAAKGTKTDDEWSNIASQLRDIIRRRQRDALVNFVLSNPSSGNLYRWQNVNDLYAYLLIDTQMEPVMQSSRIKQATSTVQLYIDRVLMNLEYSGGDLTMPVSMTTESALQWKQWRKWYSIWEPNRQIFLYPENFMEPALRDDKTTFFEDLEAQLLQESVTADNAEEAIRQYLYSLEDVARLEPVGSCNDTDAITGQPITHVFARTYSDPHIYYFRRIEGDIWTRWEKIDIDISSEQVVPYVWNNKLYLFWLTFADKAAPVQTQSPGTPNSEWFYNNKQELNGEVTSSAGGSNAVYYKQLEITLNFSEYKNGSWTKHKSAKDKLLIKLNPDVLKNLASYLSSSSAPPGNYYNFLTKNRTLSITDLIKSRIYLMPTPDYPNAEDLVLVVLHPNAMDDTSDESAESLHAFVFEAGANDPRVWEYYTTINRVAPSGTVIRNMKFVTNPSVSASGALYQDIIESVDDSLLYIYFDESVLVNSGQSRRATQQLLLNQNPYGSFSIVTKSIPGWQTSTLGDAFLYFDKASTFYVEQKPVPPVALPATSWTLAAANQIASLTFSVSSASQVGTRFVTGAPVNFGATQNMVAAMPTTTPIAPATSYYSFQAFYHPYILSLLAALDTGGVDNLLQLVNQPQSSSFSFDSLYQPNAYFLGSTYPAEIVDFSATGAYSQYNWEIFFHIPMLIAQSLSDNQQFEDAQKWYHYIFDPTSNVDGTTGAYSSSVNRFWKFWPFYNQATQSIETLSDLMNAISANNPDAVSQIITWEENPFDPYAIGRIRTLAFMKNVVMKYIDNLIAWGDYLFTQDTLESINEATQLYILAANILGDKPTEVSRYENVQASTFNDLSSVLDLFSNAAIAVENYVNLVTGSTTYPFSSPPMATMQYFCLPNNDQLLAYWDTIADRLFKIRNSENIAGQFQQLPLFEPPINPALLVRAAAAGIDVSSILNDQTTASLPNYRFTYMVQKANELCSDVKALGSALLSALEKQDAENMALLRSGLELTVLNSMLQMKTLQLQEANDNLDAANASLLIAQGKQAYYKGLPYVNTSENAQINSMKTAIHLQNIQAYMQGAVYPTSYIPQFHGEFTSSVGGEFGGIQISGAFAAASTLLGVLAGIQSANGGVQGLTGSFDRRFAEWAFQADQAGKEIDQINKQILAAQVRVQIAQNDLDTQQIQIDNNRALDDFMRTKYTNADLYNWMITQISTTYFQAYQLAFAYAKKAAKCFDHELPFAALDSSNFISFGYWDSLKKGLQAGEKLQYDLRKLEAAYIDYNIREFEMTKHISLALFAPEKLIQIRETGACSDLELPAWLFDLDYPGNYMRRIKSVSISIPCVAGPYTTISCQLQMTDYSIENSDGTIPTPQYPANVNITIQSSSAQNDNGLFELNFRDERYLPFEGYGAISTWALNMMQDPILRQFDYTTISDVVMHMKYTAQDNSSKATTRIESLKQNLIEGTGDAQITLPCYFSLKHSFANQWFAYSNAFATDSDSTLNITITPDQFPFFCQGRTINISSLLLVSAYNAGPLPTYGLSINESVHTLSGSMPTPSAGTVVSCTLTPASAIVLTTEQSFDLGFERSDTHVAVNIDTILADLYLVVEYTLS